MRALRSDIVWVLLLLGAALFFRWPQIDDSLWLDELHTDWTIESSLGEVAPRARMGNNFPTYFYLTYGTSNLFGQSERALRLPSLLAGLAAITTVYFLARRWTESMAAAVAAAGLVVMDPHALFYSIEARPQFLGVTALATAIIWGVFAIAIGIGRSNSSSNRHVAQQASTELGTQSNVTPQQFTARLVKNYNAQWVDGTPAITERSRLNKDQKLQLAAGFSLIEFSSGARVVLQGPATFVISGRNGGHLELGQLTARVGDREKGFTVSTPKSWTQVANDKVLSITGHCLERASATSSRLVVATPKVLRIHRPRGECRWLRAKWQRNASILDKTTIHR